MQMAKMKKTILHIVDDEETRDAVKDILDGHGMRVVGAKNGNEGLKKAKELKPDLVLLDVMMPDMSGWDVFAKLKKDGIKSKVAFLTVIEGSGPRMKKLKEEGVSDYIVKPIAPDDLKQRIEKILAASND